LDKKRPIPFEQKTISYDYWNSTAPLKLNMITQANSSCEGLAARTPREAFLLRVGNHKFNTPAENLFTQKDGNCVFGLVSFARNNITENTN